MTSVDNKELHQFIEKVKDDMIRKSIRIKAV
jgi:hypothetical protein